MGTHRPPVVMPDMKRRRASTGEKIETIMNLARAVAPDPPDPRRPARQRHANPDGVRGGMDECELEP